MTRIRRHCSYPKSNTFAKRNPTNRDAGLRAAGSVGRVNIFTCLVIAWFTFLGATMYANSSSIKQNDPSLSDDAKAYYLGLAHGLTALADEGYLEACLELADMYSKGEKIPKDVDKAISSLKKPAALKSVAGRYKLAELYRNEKNYLEAIEIYKSLLSEKGPSGFLEENFPLLSAVALAAMYKNGEGVKQDFKQALKFSRHEATLPRDFSSTSSSPNSSLNDVEFKPGSKEASEKNYHGKYYEIIKALADNGSVTASYKYAHDRWPIDPFPPDAGQPVGPPPLDPKEIERERRRLLKYYEYAASRGLLDAQEGLAFSCRHLKDWNCSIKWYDKAAKAGSVDALLGLADLYSGRRIWRDAPVDKRKSLSLLKEAAATGNALALYDLGSAYLLGEITAVDFQKAEQFYRMAAAKGNAGACRELILLYTDGFQMPLDPGKALINKIRRFDLTREGGEDLSEDGLFYRSFDANEWSIGMPKKTNMQGFKNLIFYGDGSKLLFVNDLLKKGQAGVSTIPEEDMLVMRERKPFFVIGEIRSNALSLQLAEISIDGDEKTWWVPFEAIEILER